MPRTYKRATTDEQKKEILEDLLSIWKENPDLRLTQLIGNVYPCGPDDMDGHDDPYFVYAEDYDFINEISAFYAPEEET